MSRLLTILAAIVLVSCSRPDSPLKDILPVQVQRAWTLEEAKALPNAEAPALIQGQSLQRALSAAYRGNGRIAIRVFEMRSQTNAFELIQKWRQTDGLAFYKGPYFVIANAEGVDKETLSSFLHALEQDMKVSP